MMNTNCPLHLTKGLQDSEYLDNLIIFEQIHWNLILPEVHYSVDNCYKILAVP